MKNQNRKPQFNFEADTQFLDELKEVARVTGMKSAELIRQAVMKELAELRRTHPRFQSRVQTTVNA